MNSNLDNMELRSEEVQEVLARTPNWMIRWGNALFLSLIFLIVSLLWFIKYPDIILSEAILTTQIPPQKEYARTSGKIDTILVTDKQIVYKNQPLAVLESASLFSDIMFLKSIVDTIKPNKRVFDFPIENLPILFLGDIESDFVLFENNYIQYQLNKQLEPYLNEDVSNRFTVNELNRRLTNIKSQKSLTESELVLKKRDLERNRVLFEKGVISAIEYEKKQIEYLQAERNFQNIIVSISQVREAISNANKSKRVSDINHTKDDMVLLKSVFQSFNQLKRSIREWELQYLLKADIDGKVSFLNFWEENQTVNQGDLVFTIIPNNNSNFIARLRTPTQNSGKLKVGQKVKIKLENYPEEEFGSLPGAITSISAIPDEEGFYLVDVGISEKLLTSYNIELEFKQEMRGTAEIITEDLRLIERFFYQLRTAISRQ